MTTRYRTMPCFYEGPNGVGRQLDVTWRYFTPHPYAIELRVTPRTSEWVFARCLLSEGLTDPAGWGDVLVRPVRSCTQVTLRSPDGTGVLTFARDLIYDMVDEIERLVPPGREYLHFNLDKEIRRTFRGVTS